MSGMDSKNAIDECLLKTTAGLSASFDMTNSQEIAVTNNRIENTLSCSRDMEGIYAPIIERL